MFYFQENSDNREKQVEIIKNKLRKKFDYLFLEKKITLNEHGYEHTKMCWVSNKLADFISYKDNSIRGFKTKCVADFE